MSKPNKIIVENMCKARKIPVDLIDYKAYWDSSLSQTENYAILREEIDKIAHPKQANNHQKYVEMEKEQREQVIQELTVQAIKKAKTEKTSIDSYYNNLERFIKMTAGSSKTHGLLLSGSPGMGKSRNVFRLLSKNKIPFKVIQGHITPKEMYLIMRENNKKNQFLVLDDTLEIMKQPSCMGLVYSGLNSESGPRTIQWRSSKNGSGLDESTYEGKIIFIINAVPKNFIVAPLLDRCFPYHLGFSYQERFEMMTKLAKTSKHKHKAFEVIDFLKSRITNETKDNASLRTYNRVLEIRLSYPRCWKTLASQLDTLK